MYSRKRSRAEGCRRDGREAGQEGRSTSAGQERGAAEEQQPAHWHVGPTKGSIEGCQSCQHPPPPPAWLEPASGGEREGPPFGRAAGTAVQPRKLAGAESCWGTAFSPTMPGSFQEGAGRHQARGQPREGAAGGLRIENHGPALPHQLPGTRLKSPADLSTPAVSTHPLAQPLPFLRLHVLCHTHAQRTLQSPQTYNCHPRRGRQNSGCGRVPVPAPAHVSCVD